MDKETQIIMNKFENSSELKKAISQFVGIKEVVLLFFNEEDTEAFSAGYVEAVSSNEILMTHLDAFGKKDGMIVKRFVDIIKMESDGKYSKKISILDKLNKNKYSREEINTKTSSLFQEVLRYAYCSKKIVSIELLESHNEDMVGYVDAIEGNLVTIKLVDIYGACDGKGTVNIQDITHLVCDSEQEASLDKLMRYKQND